ncbi:MAG: hypothetical protein NT027_10785 [Proteobacteria bacterium]|nr:hypothetical protein [Pseudomonadota bacterium]
MNLNENYLRAGTTRTEKMIPYTLMRKDIPRIIQYFQTQNFSDDDLLDVFAVFEFLALRSRRRPSNTEVFFEEHADEVFKMISEHDIETAKTRAGIFSAFQLRDLGERLVTAEFINL